MSCMQWMLCFVHCATLVSFYGRLDCLKILHGRISLLLLLCMCHHFKCWHMLEEFDFLRMHHAIY